MNATKGTVFATNYGVALTREQTLHLHNLDHQSYDCDWYNIERYDSLSTQLDKLDGIYNTDYDLMFAYDGLTFQLETEFDTDENWEKINETIRAYLARELALDPPLDEDDAHQ